MNADRWLVERVDVGQEGSIAERLALIEQTHDIVSVVPDPENPDGFVIAAKLRPVGYDA